MQPPLHQTAVISQAKYKPGLLPRKAADIEMGEKKSKIEKDIEVQFLTDEVAKFTENCRNDRVEER